MVNVKLNVTYSERGQFKSYILTKFVKMPVYPNKGDSIVVDGMDYIVNIRLIDLDECPDGSFEKYITKNNILKLILDEVKWTEGDTKGLDEELVRLEAAGWNVV